MAQERKLIALAVLAVSLSTGCGRPDAAREDEGTAPDTECVDRSRGFSVSYPAGWHVNAADVLPPCSLFHPEPFDVPVNSEVPIDIAVLLDIEPIKFETAVHEDAGRRDLSLEETTVDGREAVRIEGETTGEGLHDRGIRLYQYFVNLGDSTMLAVTYDAGPVPFTEKRRVLDSIMSSVEFLPAEP